MADTAANIQFKVENGLLVRGEANFESNTTTVGAVSITNTFSTGNTTITGFANISSTANVGGAATLRGTLTVNGAVTVANTLATGNTSITGSLSVSTTSIFSGNINSNVIPQANGNYLGNSTSTWVLFASNGNFSTRIDSPVANAANLFITEGAYPSANGKLLGNTISRWDITSNNIVAVTAQIHNNVRFLSTNATFNALTGVANSTEYIASETAHVFANGDYLQYVVSTGNTAVTGLSNGSFYFVVNTTNSTHLQLSSTYNGSVINVTAGTSETGHTLVPIRIVLDNNGSIFAPSGIANVGTLRVLGTAVVNGSVTIGNTVSSGNTDITGFINVSSSANIGGATTLRGTLTVNGAVTVANTLATGNVTVTGFANISTTLAAGNTSLTGFINVSSTANVGGDTNLRGNLAVNGAVTISNTLSVGNTVLNGSANVIGSIVTFNALTDVSNTTEFITSASHGLSNGDYVQYLVAAGNTNVTGLSNATYYYVIGANSTAFQLSASYGGAAINVTASVNQTGHTLTPLRIFFSNNGNISSPVGLANVGSLRVLGAATVNGLATVGSLNITAGPSTISGNVTFDTDLLFLDAENNRIGIKNNSPSSADLVTIGGNVVFNASNTTGLRFTSANASHNSYVSLIGNTANTRLTFSTNEANATHNDGGFSFQTVNSSATTSVLLFNQAEFKYKSSNVTHAGNFGIYNVSGTRVGP